MLATYGQNEVSVDVILEQLPSVMQVIVMSGHETIRVLEVEVDTSLTSSSSEGKAGVDGEDGGKLSSEGGAQKTPAGKNKTTEGELLSAAWFPLNLFTFYMHICENMAQNVCTCLYFRPLWCESKMDISLIKGSILTSCGLKI